MSQWIAKKTSYGQETLDKAFLILYICRSNYQWIKEKFKNNEKAKIQVELKSTTGEMTLNGMATSEINKKVQLSEFKIFDLNTKDSNENSFRIRGRAESTPTTEVGEYKGLMEVIITILPE